MIKTVVKFIATGGWSGFAPVVPGTIGTIPAWLIAWFFLVDHWVLLAAAVVVFFVSVWSAGRMESELGHDSKQIVIDEWAGMLVALLFLPHRLDVYIASFLFFRFYDVIKPYPSGRCEALP